MLRGTPSSSRRRTPWQELASSIGPTGPLTLLARSPKDGSDYYEIWLEAFECFLVERGLAERSELAALKDAWTRAYLTTPHGAPVELKR